MGRPTTRAPMSAMVEPPTTSMARPEASAPQTPRHTYSARGASDWESSIAPCGSSLTGAAT